MFLFSIMLLIDTALASKCFIIKEKNQIIHQEGDCDKRYAPMSTFKIVLSLIGYDTGILIDKNYPVWPFKEGYVDSREEWKKDHTPQSWMKESCVWYSQILTKQLGTKRFQDYVKKFAYGNRDLSGDMGRDNGLTNCWLSSSLEISSIEQILFLEQLLTNKLPVSKHAYVMTKNILFLENLKDDWKLYGKTGMGSLLSTDRNKKLNINHGWFIGWIEKGNRQIIFAIHIADSKKEDTYVSLRAKANAREKLMQIINNIGNNQPQEDVNNLH